MKSVILLGILVLLSSGVSAVGNKYPIFGPIVPCEQSTCPYCCIKYPEYDFPVCSDDILRCKLKKLGNFEDIQILAIVLALSLFGLPLFLTALRWFFFAKFYKDLSLLGLTIRWARMMFYMAVNCKKPPKSFYKNVTLYTEHSLSTQSHQNNSSGGAGVNAAGKTKGLARLGTGKADGSMARSKTVRKRTKKRSILFEAESEDEDEVEVHQQNNDTDFFAHLSDGLSDDSDYPPEAYAFVRPNNNGKTSKVGSQAGSPNKPDGMLGMMHEEVMMEDEDDD